MRRWTDSLLWAAAVATWIVLRLFGRSYRVQLIAGAEVLERLRNRPRPVLLTFWHEHSFFFAYFLYHHLHRQGVPITLFASRSRDGELVARVGRLWGLRAVRGSSSRGGTEGLRQLYKAVVKDGGSPITIPDGPRGPARRCKPGVVALAQTTRAPILPLSYSADRAWRLRSWDRLIIPRPFSRVAVAVAEMVEIPRQLDAVRSAAELDRVEQILNDTGALARQVAAASVPGTA